MRGISASRFPTPRILLSLASVVTGALIASTVLGGCVNQNVAAETVTWQAAEDFNCPPSDITIQEIRIHLYEAAGCDNHRQYQVSGECTKDSNCMAGHVRGMGKGVGP